MSKNIIAGAEDRAALERWEDEGGSVLAVDSLRGPSSDFHGSFPEDVDFIRGPSRARPAAHHK